MPSERLVYFSKGIAIPSEEIKNTIMKNNTKRQIKNFLQATKKNKPLILQNKVPIEPEYGWNPCINEIPMVVSAFINEAGYLMLNVKIDTATIQTRFNELEPNDLLIVFLEIEKTMRQANSKTIAKTINDCIEDLETMCSKDDIKNIQRQDLEESVISIYERLLTVREIL